MEIVNFRRVLSFCMVLPLLFIDKKVGPLCRSGTLLGLRESRHQVLQL